MRTIRKLPSITQVEREMPRLGSHFETRNYKYWRTLFEELNAEDREAVRQLIRQTFTPEQLARYKEIVDPRDIEALSPSTYEVSDE